MSGSHYPATRRPLWFALGLFVAMSLAALIVVLWRPDGEAGALALALASEERKALDEVLPPGWRTVCFASPLADLEPVEAATGRRLDPMLLGDERGIHVVLQNADGIRHMVFPHARLAGENVVHCLRPDMRAALRAIGRKGEQHVVEILIPGA